MCVLIASYYYDSIKHQRLRVTLCVIEPLAAVTQQACGMHVIVQQKVTVVLLCSRSLPSFDCCTQAGVHYIEGRATVKDKHTVSINGKDYTVGSQYRPTVLQTAAAAQCVVLLLLNT